MRILGMCGCVLAGFLCLTSAEAKLTVLATPPDWSELDKFQETITKDDFLYFLDRVYAPGGAASKDITFNENSARISRGKGRAPFVLRFAPSRGEAKAVPAFWRGKAAMGGSSEGKPLAGLKIAIDPGHIGGDWAKMEERWFRVGNRKPVTEGDMTLHVAKLLVPRLTSLGAKVYLTRSKAAPVTSLRPSKLKDEARKSLADKEKPATPFALQKESELLFYRAGEIRRRARLVNESIRPDLVLCLHFNAEEWGSEKTPRLVEENHLHFLITGSWNASELEYDDQRFEMLVKLLSRTFPEELALTDVLAKQMAKGTGLPPYLYRSANAIRVNDNPYIWARNLLANRLFTCPVVYVEPYVMNSRETFARIQAGDYEGTRKLRGVPRKSIYREYADALTAGLVEYYGTRR